MKTVPFIEKQNIGNNKFYFIIRMIVAIFCMIGYYWSQNPKPVKVSVIKIGSYPAENIPNSGELFFFIALLVVVLSVVLSFVLHIKTIVDKEQLIIDGLWTKKRIVIEVRAIKSIKKRKVRNSFFRKPIYNLTISGITRFYTYGDEMLEITLRDNRIIRLGTQKPGELKASLLTDKTM